MWKLLFFKNFISKADKYVHTQVHSTLLWHLHVCMLPRKVSGFLDKPRAEHLLGVRPISLSKF